MGSPQPGRSFSKCTFPVALLGNSGFNGSDPLNSSLVVRGFFHPTARRSPRANQEPSERRHRMKILPLLASAMSGSMAGVTASHNKGGAYLRSRTIPTNPASTAQVALRNATAAATQRWSSVLTDLQRDGWDLYAQNTSWTDKLGQTIQLSGVNHYVRSNSIRAYATQQFAGLSPQPPATPFIDQAPSIFSLGETPMLNVFIQQDIGPPVATTLDVIVENAAAYAAEDILMIFPSAPVNPALRFFAGPYYFSGMVAPPPAGNSSVVTFNDEPYSRRYPVPLEDQAIWGFARVSHADGRLSSRSRFGPITVPAPA